MRQLFNYGLIGIINNGMGYTIYLLLTFFGISPKITMTLVYGTIAVIGFFGNCKLTFKHKENLWNTGARYMFAQLCGYCINLVILLILVDNFQYNHQVVQAIAIITVAGFLFVACKYFVFREQNTSWSIE